MPIEAELAELRRTDPELPFLGLEYEKARLDRMGREGKEFVFFYEGCGTSSILTCEYIASPGIQRPPVHTLGGEVLSCETTEVNGVPAVFVEYEDDFAFSTSVRELVVFTSRYVMRISEGTSDHDALLRRARAARPLSHPDSPADELAPPVPTNPPVVRGCPKR